MQAFDVLRIPSSETILPGATARLVSRSREREKKLLVGKTAV